MSNNNQNVIDNSQNVKADLPASGSKFYTEKVYIYNSSYPSELIICFECLTISDDDYNELSETARSTLTQVDSFDPALEELGGCIAVLFFDSKVRFRTNVTSVENFEALRQAFDDGLNPEIHKDLVDAVIHLEQNGWSRFTS